MLLHCRRFRRSHIIMEFQTSAFEAATYTSSAERPCGVWCLLALTRPERRLESAAAAPWSSIEASYAAAVQDALLIGLGVLCTLDWQRCQIQRRRLRALAAAVERTAVKGPRDPPHILCKYYKAECFITYPCRWKVSDSER